MLEEKWHKTKNGLFCITGRVMREGTSNGAASIKRKTKPEWLVRKTSVNKVQNVISSSNGNDM